MKLSTLASKLDLEFRIAKSSENLFERAITKLFETYGISSEYCEDELLLQAG